MKKMFREFAIVALVAVVAACSATQLQTSLTKANADVATFNTNLNADLSVLAANSAGACNAAAVLHAGFLDAAALSPKVAEQSATEASAYAIVAATCANPPTNASAAAVTLVGQVKAVQAIVKGTPAAQTLQPAVTAPASPTS